VKRAVRKVDLAARYGGEEFVVLLDDASEEGGVQLAERIRAEIEALQCEENGERVPVTLSLGVASYPQDGRTPEALTKAADSGLYFAKRNGKNRAATRTQALSSGTLD
jgi:diguanylate cyclase (GGDEF)-like protein